MAGLLDGGAARRGGRRGLLVRAAARAVPGTESRWAVVQCVNPDGLLAGTRQNANGVDLNRNFPASTWRPGAVLHVPAGHRARAACAREPHEPLLARRPRPAPSPRRRRSWRWSSGCAAAGGRPAHAAGADPRARRRRPGGRASSPRRRASRRSGSSRASARARSTTGSTSRGSPRSSTRSSTPGCPRSAQRHLPGLDTLLRASVWRANADARPSSRVLRPTANARQAGVGMGSPKGSPAGRARRRLRGRRLLRRDVRGRADGRPEPRPHYAELAAAIAAMEGKEPRRAAELATVRSCTEA